MKYITHSTFIPHDYIVYRSTIYSKIIDHRANNSNKEQYIKEHSYKFQRYSRREWNLWNLWECSL